MNWDIDLAKKLYFRFAIIWGNKFTSQHTTTEMIDMWAQDWYEALIGIEPQSIKVAIDYCKLNNEWPPSIAEFRKVCQRWSGIPSPEEAMQLAIRRDFSHPIVREIFDRVGSWDMSHAKESILIKKFEKLHAELSVGTLNQIGNSHVIGGKEQQVSLLLEGTNE